MCAGKTHRRSSAHRRAGGCSRPKTSCGRTQLPSSGGSVACGSAGHRFRHSIMSYLGSSSSWQSKRWRRRNKGDFHHALKQVCQERVFVLLKMDVIQFSICSEQATQQKLERIKQNKLQKDARGNGISATAFSDY